MTLLVIGVIIFLLAFGCWGWIVATMRNDELHIERGKHAITRRYMDAALNRVETTNTPFVAAKRKDDPRQ